MEFPRLSGTIALDLETRDPDLKIRGPGWCFPDAGEIVGVALAWDGGRHAAYYPLAHEGGGNLDEVDAFWTWLRDLGRDKSLTWIFHNRLYDEGWLRRAGIPIRGKKYDTGVVAPLLDEYKPDYGLDALLAEYLGERKDEQKLRDFNKAQKWRGDHKTNLWRMPAWIVRDYAMQDAGGTLRLWEKTRPMIDAQDLHRVFEMETRLADVLLEMRWRGVRVDLDRADRYRSTLREAVKAAQKALDTHCGFPVSVMSANSVAKAFDAEGLPYPVTKEGKPSFEKKWLLAHPAKLATLVQRVRRANKAESTFIEGYVFKKQVNGRVHAQFPPLSSEEGGAVTGRFSSSLPNLQNLPSPDKDDPELPIGRMVRSCFLPEEGEEWCAADYSQQEPRWMVHFAEVSHVRGGVAAAEAFRDNPDLDYHQFIADITGLTRKEAKPINLGIGYGMGGAKLCRSLGLSTQWIEIERNGKRLKIEIAGPEGQAILDQYHGRAPFVKGLTELCSRKAKQRGYVRTHLGRRCRFPAHVSWHYRAMNRVIQGSSADQTKMAMLALWDAGVVPLVPVHDELGLSVESRERGAECVALMRDVIPMRVPMKVDAEYGPSWGEAA